ncbi:uncharacterized protein TNCV_4469711 [Trichonephila clavipes]|nr:uncharacterized protein TNCV_4469711 [Trichonephila clavipes]
MTPELTPPLLTTTPHQREDVSALDRFSVHRCPTRRVFSGTGLELVTKPATIRCLYHSATAATPTYDGSESLGIRGFFGKINDVAELGGWSNAEKVTILKLKLAGIAEEFFLSDPTHSHLTNYNDIARVLITRFLRGPFRYLRGSNYSPHTFRVRPESRFISGLRNDIRRFVLARDPNTLEESINAALIEEQNLKLNEIASNERSGLSSLPTESPVISALTDKLQELNLRVERLVQ